MELVQEYPSLGMFSASREFSRVGLLDSCSSVEPSPPACRPSLQFVLSSTSNSIVPNQSITATASALKITISAAGSKRRALFCKEESEGSSTVVKTGLPDHLPLPDRFSIRIEEAVSADQVLSVRRQIIVDLGSFHYALSKRPLLGDYKRMALAIYNKFPDLRDSNPSSY